MTRLLAIPGFFLGVMLFALIGMLQERFAKIETTAPEKAFVFSLMVLLSMGAFVVLAGSGVIAIKGVPF